MPGLGLPVQERRWRNGRGGPQDGEASALVLQGAAGRAGLVQPGAEVAAGGPTSSPTACGEVVEEAEPSKLGLGEKIETMATS